MSGITPSQTVGPYFGILIRGRSECRQVSAATDGTRIVIEGHVFDGNGHAIPDALVETWQADARGHYPDPETGAAETVDTTFNGYGWAHTGADGGFRFETIKPGRVPAPGDGDQAPHVVVSIMARGILTRFITRIYFDDEPANAQDPILGMVPADRRHTLIAQHAGDGRYFFNVAMQGAGETVFFDV